MYFPLFFTLQLGTSALHIAAKNNFYDTCSALLRSGISKDAKTKVDRTPLHFAAFEGNYEICQLLIQYAVDLDPPDLVNTVKTLKPFILRIFRNIVIIVLVENDTSSLGYRARV